MEVKMAQKKIYDKEFKIQAVKLGREIGFSKAAMNGDFVYVVKSAGRYHVIGSKDYRTVTQPAGDTGDAAGSAKGCTIEITAPDVTPLPIYQGVIVTADGSLDCATDTFTPAA